MGIFSEKIGALVDSASPLITAIAALSLLIVGVMCIYPDEQTKEKGKRAIPWVAIGVAIALSAKGIASSFASGF